MKMKKYILSLLAVLFLIPTISYGQKVGLKTNALYWATTTPNLGVEVALSQKFTLALSAGWNPFDLRTRKFDDGSCFKTRVKHLLIMPELKYWNCCTFQRSFWGVHGIYSHYNVGGISFIDALDEHRYQGDAFGGGISYGYQWALGSRWGLEASVGAGFLHLDYEKHHKGYCEKGLCGEFLGNFTKNYWGPTKVEVSFIYYFK